MSSTKPAQESAILYRSLKAFMAGYADDLRSGNRESLAARYHPDGTYFLGGGDKVLKSRAYVTQRYLNEWNAPSAFEWVDLTYEAIDSGGVLVLGKFRWTAATSGESVVVSYSALLLNMNGELKIRVEHETRSQRW